MERGRHILKILRKRAFWAEGIGGEVRREWGLPSAKEDALKPTQAPLIIRRMPENTMRSR